MYIIKYAVLKGLRPDIRSHVLQNNAKTIADVLSFGSIAEQVRPGAPALRDVTSLGLGGQAPPPRMSQPPQTGTVIGLFCTAVLDIMLL